MVNSAQNNTKIFMDLYFDKQQGEVYTHVTRDNNLTPLPFFFAYDLPDYPIPMIFKTLVYDLAFSIAGAKAEPVLDWDASIKGYQELVTVTAFMIDKTGVTAVKCLEKVEAEMRRILETYGPAASFRSLSSQSPTSTRVGAAILWSTEFVIAYGRDTA